MPTTYAIPNGSTAFAATTYTGANPNAATSITGVGFQPDFTWIKSRVTGYGQALFDSVRGATRRLQTDTSSAEATSSTYLTSFNSNGFSLGVDYGQNAPSEPYISWNWKANGGAVTNTAGSITSQVSANTAAGFSVVTGTFPASGTSCTFGHGLGVAPSMIINKGRDGGTSNWIVRHTSLGNMTTKYLEMNNTGAVATGPNAATAPSSTLASVSTDGLNNNMAFVAYCFAAVPGYSAFGSYTGNGSTDGPFVYLGFRPRFIMFKDASSAQNWVILDSSRDPYNIAGNYLLPNTSSSEFTSSSVDFLSNGFKIRYAGGSLNTSSDNIVYAAFAETPFAYSNAR
jgi:hypothetical protein